MKRRDAAPPRGARGFTLIELLVALALISLIAGALAPMGMRNLRAAQIEKTRTRMDALVRGMIGDPAQDDFGYLGDLGALPPALTDLNDATGKPAFAVNASDGIGYGWGGPYAPNIAAPGVAIVDAWSVGYQYNAASAQLRSAGPDRAFATADDLLRPLTAPATLGNLAVSALGVPNTGDPAQPLTNTDVTLYVASSLGGVRSEQAMGGTGPFTTNGLHLGLHSVRAVGIGAYAGAAIARGVVAIKRGSTHLTLILEQP